MTGTQQRVTSAYHPQRNGLVERQNRTIKNALVKVLDQNLEQCPYVIDGVLFAHRVSRHASTNHSPFYLMYSREPVLPIDLKYAPNSEPATLYDSPFDQDMFEAVFASANMIRVDIQEAAGRNIKKVQEKQKRDFDCLHVSSTNVKVGDRVLLENKRRHARKGGKYSYRWLGPYTVIHIHISVE